ncbi:MAG: RNA methyltransferase, partial [Bifidobacteriaceae bacterium]|nr:RNA methyltransferase [Bifidobacteriaceae bacterium]
YVHPVTAAVMEKISKDSQGIAAVAHINAVEHRGDFHTELSKSGASVAAFWQIRDPGNAGAVIRAADAAGCDAVIFVDDCVEVCNPKVVRSTAGSLFHIPTFMMSTQDFFDWAHKHAMHVIAADVYGTPERKPVSLLEVLTDPNILDASRVVLFGNEARGLEADVLSQADSIISIPIYGKAESLNLATSAAVMLLTMAMSSHIGKI